MQGLFRLTADMSDWKVSQVQTFSLPPQLKGFLVKKYVVILVTFTYGFIWVCVFFSFFRVSAVVLIF